MDIKNNNKYIIMVNILLAAGSLIFVGVGISLLESVPLAMAVIGLMVWIDLTLMGWNSR